MIGPDEIRAAFAAPLAKIRDGKLREKVVQVFVAACRAGGWETMEALAAMPFTLLTDCRDVSFLEHTLAVTEGAYGLAMAQIESYHEMPYGIDLDRLVAGGLLHDVGKLVEIEPDGAGGYRKSRAGKLARHPISGAIFAAMAGLPDEIVNTIACHAKEGDGRSKVIETVLIHQADFATFDPLVMKAGGTLVE